MNPALSPHEHKLRDYLAEHLELIEPGLSLRGIEYPLENQDGAPGRIDILARDRFGNFVVIELKRSNAAARTAVHELFKYTSLLQSTQGIHSNRIRCVLISTDWHELLVPFSEFVRITALETKGFKLVLAESTGLPLELHPVTPLEDPSPAAYFRSHLVFAHGSVAARSRAQRSIHDCLVANFIQDFVILDIQYIGGSDAFIYPFANYVAFALPSGASCDSFVSKLKADGIDVDELIYDDPDYWHGRQMLCLLTACAVSEEIGTSSPERALQIFHTWQITKTHRMKNKVNSLLTADDIKEILTGFGGEGNRVAYAKFCTPRFAAQWGDALDKLEYALASNFYWSGTRLYLNAATELNPAAEVAIAVFNPMNILRELFESARTGSLEYLPRLEIFVRLPQGIRRLMGLVEWDRLPGRLSMDSLLECLPKRIRKADRLMNAILLGCQDEYETQIMKALGLKYSLLEVRQADDGTYTRFRVETSGSGLSFSQIDLAEFTLVVESSRDFFRGNERFLMDLISFFESRVVFVR